MDGLLGGGRNDQEDGFDFNFDINEAYGESNGFEGANDPDYAGDSQQSNGGGLKGVANILSYGTESNKLPVTRAISGDLDLGFSTISGGWILILQGPDVGKIVGFKDVGAGFSIPDFDGNLKQTDFFVTGDVNQFTISSLKGERTELIVGGTLSHINITGSITRADNSGPWGRVYGISVGVGAGVIPIWGSFGVGYGETTIYE